MTAYLEKLIILGSADGIFPELRSFKKIQELFQCIFIEDMSAVLNDYAEYKPTLLALLETANASTMNAIEKLRMALPDSQIILAAKSFDPHIISTITRLRIADVIELPATEDKCLDALLLTRQKAQPINTTVHGLIGASAGVGATTLALSLAALFKKKNKRSSDRTALFDLDFSTAGCARALNFATEFDVRKALQDPMKIDFQYMEFLRQNTEFFSLYSLKSRDILRSVEFNTIVLNMLDTIVAEYSTIIIDIPFYDFACRDAIIEALDTLTIVTRPTLPSLSLATELVDEIKGIKTDARIALLINLYESGFFQLTPSKQDIATMFDEHTPFYLRADRKSLQEAENRGILPQDLNHRSRFCKDLEQFAEHFIFIDRLSKKK